MYGAGDSEIEYSEIELKDKEAWNISLHLDCHCNKRTYWENFTVNILIESNFGIMFHINRTQYTAWIKNFNPN